MDCLRLKKKPTTALLSLCETNERKKEVGGRGVYGDQQLPAEHGNQLRTARIASEPTNSRINTCPSVRPSFVIARESETTGGVIAAEVTQVRPGRGEKNKRDPEFVFSFDDDGERKPNCVLK